MNKKKILSMLLACCLLVGMLPAALAEEPETQPPTTESDAPQVGTPQESMLPQESELPQEIGLPQDTEPPAPTEEGENSPEPPAAPSVGEPQAVNEEPAATTPTPLPTPTTVPGSKTGKDAITYYNGFFAQGQDVIVEPATSNNNGVLVTVGETQYTFSNNSTANQGSADSDGLTIIAGWDNDTTSNKAAQSSTITIKNGAKVGAIFGGNYKTGPDFTSVTINVEQGAEVGVLYSGGLSVANDSSSSTKTKQSTVKVDGTVGLIYAGGSASVGPGLTQQVTFTAGNNTATALNWVGKSNVTINGTVRQYFGGSYSYGGVGEVNCTVNGTLGQSGQQAKYYSAVCGTNGYRGTAKMTVAKDATLYGDLYLSMRGYVGDTTLENHGTIARVSLNPDGKDVSSYGNVYVNNDGTITACNLDCGCAKTAAGNSISPWPTQIVVSGDVTVSTKNWEANTNSFYTADDKGGQTIILLDGAKMAADETPITNLAVAQSGEGDSANYYTKVADALNAGGMVKLIQDVSEDVNVTAGSETTKCTLDLNGHTLSNKSGTTLTNAADLTICDSGTTGTLQHSASGQSEAGDTAATSYAIQNTGTLTIQSGTFKGGLSNGENAKISITGGTFSTDPKEFVAEGYTVEKSGESFKVVQKAVIDDTTITLPEATVDKDGKAETTVTSNTVDSITDVIADVSGGTAETPAVVTIDASTLPSGSTAEAIKTSEVQIPKAIMNAAKEKDNVALAIKTPVGEIQLDKEASTKLAAESGNVTLTIAKTGDEGKAPKFEVKFTDTNTVVMEKVSIKLTFNVDKNLSNPSLICIDNGKIGALADQTYNKENGTITGTTTHLSSFSFTDLKVEAATTGGLGKISKVTSTYSNLPATEKLYMTVEATTDGKNTFLTIPVDSGTAVPVSYANGATLTIWITYGQPDVTNSTIPTGVNILATYQANT